MSLSFTFTKAAAAKTARWATVPALATAAVAMAAGPALAAGSTPRLGITTAAVSHGQVTVRGYYQCSRWTRSEQLQVSVSGMARHERVEASGGVRVNCTGTTQGWRLTLVPARRGEHFSAGAVRVDANLWSRHDRDDQAHASRILFARWA